MGSCFSNTILKLKLGIIFLFLGGSVFSTTVKDTVIKYDSALIQTISPERVREEKLFSDPELQHNQETVKDINWFDRFIDWFSRNLFGDASYETRDTIINIILWVLSLAGLGVIIWLATRTEFVSFLRGKRLESEFSFTDMEEDIKGINFEERITKAYNEKNYRLAIRWCYLKQLNNLNNAGLISWQSHKTNIDYGKELAKTNFKAGFVDLSRVYDFVWYGQYLVTEQDYLKLKQKFTDFEEQVRAHKNV